MPTASTLIYSPKVLLVSHSTTPSVNGSTENVNKMSGRLEGRIAIVTGCNSGIGRAIAVAYGREGAKVICANRNAQSQDPKEQKITTHDLINKEGGEAIFTKVEIVDLQSVKTLFKEVTRRFARVDILVNAVGQFGMGDICETSDQEYRAMM